MPKQQILVADADPRSLRVIEVSLRRAGYTVVAASDGLAALEVALAQAPDLVVCDPHLPKLDGYALVRRFKDDPERARIPVIFLQASGGVEDRIRGLELGIEDWLAKPVFVRELLARVSLALGRRTQDAFSRPNEGDSGVPFSGSTRDMSVLDLLQTFEIAGRTGRLFLRAGDRTGTIFIKKGVVVDAEAGALRGEEAVYRLFVWGEAFFEVVDEPVTREPSVDVPTQTLVLEALRRADEWGRLVEQLPPLDTKLEVDDALIAPRLAEIPDELNGILRLLDGDHTLYDVVDGSPFEDLSTLSTLAKLYFEGLLVARTRVVEVPSPVAPPSVDQPTVRVVVPARYPAPPPAPAPPRAVPPPLPVPVPVPVPVPEPVPAPEATTPMLADGEDESARGQAAPEPHAWPEDDDDLGDVAGVPQARRVPRSRIFAVLAAALVGMGTLALYDRVVARRQPSPAATTTAPLASPETVAAIVDPPIPREAAAEAGPTTMLVASAAATSDTAPAPAPAPTPKPTAPATATATATALVTAKAPPADEAAGGSERSLTRDAQRALEKGGAARAVELAQRAVRHDPGNAEAWLTLGAAQHALGRRKAALASYKTCTERAASHPSASECRSLAGLD